MTLLDLIVLCFVGVSALLSFSRGAVRETLSILSWIGAFVAAWYGYAHARPFVAAALEHELFTDLATLALVFFVPLFVLRILSGMIAEAIARSGLGSFDRLLGLFFGFARAAATVCAIYLAVGLVIDRSNYPSWVRDAALQPQIERGADWLADLLPAEATAIASTSSAEDEGTPLQDGDGNAGSGQGYSDRARDRLQDLIDGGDGSAR